MPRPNSKRPKAKDLHWFKWPLEPWRGRRLPHVPLEYLREFVKRVPTRENKNLMEKAAAELKRRSFLEDFTHTTEHAVERFTQQWIPAVIRHQAKAKEPIGVITIMKALFKRALQRGISVKTGAGNGDPNFTVALGRYRWIYCTYASDKSKKEIKILSVTPVGKGQ